MPTAQHHIQTVSDSLAWVATTPTTVVASVVAAVATPWWFTALKEGSEIAAMILPFLGCAVALFQIRLFVIKWWTGRE